MPDDQFTCQGIFDFRLPASPGTTNRLVEAAIILKVKGKSYRAHRLKNGVKPAREKPNWFLTRPCLYRSTAQPHLWPLFNRRNGPLFRRHRHFWIKDKCRRPGFDRALSLARPPLRPKRSAYGLAGLRSSRASESLGWQHKPQVRDPNRALPCCWRSGQGALCKKSSKRPGRSTRSLNRTERICLH